MTLIKSTSVYGMGSTGPQERFDAELCQPGGRFVQETGERQRAGKGLVTTTAGGSAGRAGEGVSTLGARKKGPRGRERRAHGFTIIELLITMAVIITVSAIAVPNLLEALNQAKVARAVGDIRTIEDGVTLYQLLNTGLPDDLSQVGYGGMLDPWGAPYQYLNHATRHGNGQSRKDRFLVPLNSDYDLYSLGKDGASSPPITAKPSKDDIIRAGNGSYIGLASQF